MNPEKSYRKIQAELAAAKEKLNLRTWERDALKEHRDKLQNDCVEWRDKLQAARKEVEALSNKNNPSWREVSYQNEERSVKAEDALKDLTTTSQQQAERIKLLETGLQKISEIRDSIVGQQGFNFSEHAYPIVAVLDWLGFPGEGYEISRKNLGTLIEQRNAAEAKADQQSQEIARLRSGLRNLRCAIKDFDGHGMPGFTDRALAYIVMLEADNLLKAALADPKETKEP